MLPQALRWPCLPMAEVGVHVVVQEGLRIGALGRADYLAFGKEGLESSGRKRQAVHAGAFTRACTEEGGEAAGRWQGFCAPCARTMAADILKRYFILRDNRQAGPFTIMQLRGAGLRPETLVWNEEAFGWEKAATLAELQEFLAEPAPVKPRRSLLRRLFGGDKQLT